MTVAILGGAVAQTPAYLRRAETDYRIEWYSGTGCGGQYRNKHQNSCRMTHVPTGIVRTSGARERMANLRDARAAVDRALDEMAGAELASGTNAARCGQIGSGMRGDKRRTYRQRDNQVTDHITGRTSTYAAALAGKMDAFWV